MTNVTFPRFAVADIRDVQIAWFVWVSDARAFTQAQDTPTAYKVISL